MLLCFFCLFIQTQKICYHLWMEFFLSCSRNSSYLIDYFWPCIGQKIHGNLWFLYICDHIWIPKQIDCSATVHRNHLSKIWPFFCHLFDPMQTDFKSSPEACLNTGHTHICVTIHCFSSLYSFACWWLLFTFNVL